MPQKDGVRAKRIMHKEHPHCRVIILSSIEEEAPTVKSHVCSILDKFGLQGRNLRLGLVRRKAFLCECHSAMLSCSIVSEAIKAARWAEATPDNPVISRPSVAGFGP